MLVHTICTRKCQNLDFSSTVMAGRATTVCVRLGSLTGSSDIPTDILSWLFSGTSLPHCTFFFLYQFIQACIPFHPNYQTTHFSCLNKYILQLLTCYNENIRWVSLNFCFEPLLSFSSPSCFSSCQCICIA